MKLKRVDYYNYTHLYNDYISIYIDKSNYGYFISMYYPRDKERIKFFSVNTLEEIILEIYNVIFWTLKGIKTESIIGDYIWEMLRG